MSNYPRLDETGLNTLAQALANATKSKISSEIEQVCKDTVGWIGKNLLKNTAESGSYQGITYTVNSDKSITINGTNIDSAQHAVVVGIVTLDAGDYKVNGLKNNGGYTSFWINLYNLTDSSNIIDVKNANEDLTFTLSAPKQVRVLVYWAGNATVSNITIYPMLRRADILDDTYEPYHESVEEVVEQVYADNGVLGAKNFIPMPYADKTKTVNGITFTVNSDGSITVNGTATGGYAVFSITPNSDVRLQGLRGRYIASIGKNVIQPNGMAVNIRKSDNNIWGINPGMSDIEIELTDNLYLNGWIYIYVANNTVVNNVKVYPMLRLASDPDDTYQPYAMTNRELTEKKAYIYTKGDTVECGLSLVGHVTTGATKLELTLRGNFDNANISNVSVSTARVLIRGIKGYLKTDNGVELNSRLFNNYLKLDNVDIFPQYMDLRISLISGGMFTNVDNNTLIDIQGMTLDLS